MSDYFEIAKKLTEDHAIAMGAKLTKELQDAHNDHIEPEYVTVCVYCQQETESPCCGENHHEKVLK